MKNFLLQNYLLLTYGVELLAALTGVMFYRKYKYSNAKYFIYFLVFIALAELASGYTNFIENDGVFSFLKGTVFEKNYWFGALYWSLGGILFYSYYFLKLLKSKSFVFVIKISRNFFLIFFIIYVLFNWNDYFIKPFPIIDILGAIIIFLSVIFYFIEILKSDVILTFYKSINFYIAVTIFVWWLIITPLVFFNVYYRHVDWNFIFLKWQIYLFANIIMY
ncbi:hypothetical protein ACFQ0I_09475 [Mariniflexile aquimaris]|uniref:Uncharacterized protein n=1 Tax=Mariniflexile aquimaris TaxID=881009 RepID=A0ABW3BT96_9FLAO